MSEPTSEPNVLTQGLVRSIKSMKEFKDVILISNMVQR